MSSHDRRTFLRGLAATAAGFGGLGRAAAAGLLDEPPAHANGRLVADPDGILDLPPGFGYRIISRWGDEMDDGLLVPGLHDGMAAFDGGGGRVVLVRNHEIGIDSDPRLGAFGPDLERSRVDPAMLYDADGRACPPWAARRPWSTTRRAARSCGTSCRWRAQVATVPAAGRRGTPG